MSYRALVLLDVRFSTQKVLSNLPRRRPSLNSTGSLWQWRRTRSATWRPWPGVYQTPPPSLPKVPPCPCASGVTRPVFLFFLIAFSALATSFAQGSIVIFSAFQAEKPSADDVDNTVTVHRVKQHHIKVSPAREGQVETDLAALVGIVTERGHTHLKEAGGLSGFHFTQADLRHLFELFHCSGLVRHEEGLAWRWWRVLGESQGPALGPPPDLQRRRLDIEGRRRQMGLLEGLVK